jgi:hypothetical protein
MELKENKQGRRCIRFPLSMSSRSRHFCWGLKNVPVQCIYSLNLTEVFSSPSLGYWQDFRMLSSKGYGRYENVSLAL